VIWTIVFSIIFVLKLALSIIFSWFRHWISATGSGTEEAVTDGDANDELQRVLEVLELVAIPAEIDAEVLGSRNGLGGDDFCSVATKKRGQGKSSWWRKRGEELEQGLYTERYYELG
jgi:hypothetical protein